MSLGFESSAQASPFAQAAFMSCEHLPLPFALFAMPFPSPVPLPGGGALHSTQHAASNVGLAPSAHIPTSGQLPPFLVALISFCVQADATATTRRQKTFFMET
jgi:hypothetical protein